MDWKIPLMGCRFEVRYNKVGAPYENARLLFASDYMEAGGNWNIGEEQANAYWKETFGKVHLQTLREAVKAPKDSYTEVFMQKAVGYNEEEGFHAVAYYGMRRGYIPFRLLKKAAGLDFGKKV